jgi:hypothetical protein
MVLYDGTNGQCEIYDIGANAILAAYSLGQIEQGWQVAGLGGFNDSDTSDMMVRNSIIGTYAVYAVSNNNVTSAASLGANNSLGSAAFLGAVGLEWQVAGFGNFRSLGETDMMLRNANNGNFQIYDIKDNQVIFTNSMGSVGLQWQVAGFNNHGTETDMVLRNSGTGALELYDISNSRLTAAFSLGTVGLDWQVAGFGNFSSVPGEGDMMMRNTGTGAFLIYNISNNQITSVSPMGAVGLNWQVAGFGPINGAGTSDMVLRDGNTGAFEAYDIANNQLIAAASLGQVGLDWTVAGFAPFSSTGSTSVATDSTSQLVQAMAGFGGGAADTSNTIPVGAEASQQLLLTMPQHV